MATSPTEHRAKIAEARNVLGEVIARARFADEPTVLINRGKEAAVIVSHPFYEQALHDRALLELLRQRAEEGLTGDTAAERVKAEDLHVALVKAERDVHAALNAAES
ncbi:type II toxin-antitoxin system prevent-host-death family antitoxin [Streptomyces longispororuber]|uniref:type II toxin-antitoxin system prevent-host-death family antitoxin n=1 Tax=Streptomyces longispororuber TaxID=68230 RepID=UPI0036FA1055